MYRSKDKGFMEAMKVSVLKVTKGQDKEERKYALDYLRKHVKMDDLHELALKKFPNKRFAFGQGSYNPKLVVVTKDPIKPEHKQKLELAWKKLKLSDSDVYYAHLRFVKTSKHQATRQDIVEKLINILSPNVTIIFDNVTLDNLKGECYEVGASAGVLADANQKEQRKELTTKLRSFKKQSLI
jgi:hypothetical protein